jgi:hypothetical protein
MVYVMIECKVDRGDVGPKRFNQSSTIEVSLSFHPRSRPCLPIVRTVPILSITRLPSALLICASTPPKAKHLRTRGFHNNPPIITEP